MTETRANQGIDEKNRLLLEELKKKLSGKITHPTETLEHEGEIVGHLIGIPTTTPGQEKAYLFVPSKKITEGAIGKFRTVFGELGLQNQPAVIQISGDSKIPRIPTVPDFEQALGRLD